jgi:beta-lactamase regulating signal transducer with metallopeptidase domain
MLVVDLMHEFELGVWKNLFIHLLRILHACNPALVIELDRRCVVDNDPEHLPDSRTLGTG